MIIFPDLKPLRSDLNAGEIRRNVEIALALGLQEAVLSSDNQETAGRKVAIICPGASAEQKAAGSDKTHLQILNARNDVTKILAGSAHRFLREEKLDAADAAVFNLPIGEYFSASDQPRDDLTYYVASHCPAGANEKYPSVFQQLIDAGVQDNVRLWHAHMPEGPDFGADRMAVGTGGGAAAGALALMAAMGHRNFEFYGCDGTVDYAVDLGDFPAYAASLKQDQVAIKIDDHVYTLRRNFWNQTQEMIGFIENNPDIVRSITFHGDSLNAKIFNTPDGKPRRDYQVMPGGATLAAPLKPQMP